MKIKKILTIRIILVMIGSTSLMSLNAQNLKKHKWKNRILIVKSSDLKSKKYQEQLNEFKSSFQELIDRKIILYKITGDDFVLIDYRSSESNNSGKISRKLNDKILNEKEDFEVILIGLDEGIKLQQTEILMKEDLFKIIDSMPMRKNEIIRNKMKN
jgi:hypothetical protein